MLAIGTKRQLLGESTAVELSVEPTKRDQQINANNALIKEAAGSMAPLCGHERFLVHSKTNFGVSTKFAIDISFLFQIEVTSASLFPTQLHS